jgi:hypothetical protein
MVSKSYCIADGSCVQAFVVCGHGEDSLQTVQCKANRKVAHSDAASKPTCRLASLWGSTFLRVILSSALDTVLLATSER